MIVKNESFIISISSVTNIYINQIDISNNSQREFSVSKCSKNCNTNNYFTSIKNNNTIFLTFTANKNFKYFITKYKTKNSDTLFYFNEENIGLSPKSKPFKITRGKYYPFSESDKVEYIHFSLQILEPSLFDLEKFKFLIGGVEINDCILSEDYECFYSKDIDYDSFKQNYRVEVELLSAGNTYHFVDYIYFIHYYSDYQSVSILIEKNEFSLTIKRHSDLLNTKLILKEKDNPSSQKIMTEVLKNPSSTQKIVDCTLKIELPKIPSQYIFFFEDSESQKEITGQSVCYFQKTTLDEPDVITENIIDNLLYFHVTYKTRVPLPNCTEFIEVIPINSVFLGITIGKEKTTFSFSKNNFDKNDIDFSIRVKKNTQGSDVFTKYGEVQFKSIIGLKPNYIKKGDNQNIKSLIVTLSSPCYGVQDLQIIFQSNFDKKKIYTPEIPYNQTTEFEIPKSLIDEIPINSISSGNYQIKIVSCYDPSKERNPKLLTIFKEPQKLSVGVIVVPKIRKYNIKGYLISLSSQIDEQLIKTNKNDLDYTLLDDKKTILVTGNKIEEECYYEPSRSPFQDLKLPLENEGIISVKCLKKDIDVNGLRDKISFNKISFDNEKKEVMEITVSDEIEGVVIDDSSVGPIFLNPKKKGVYEHFIKESTSYILNIWLNYKGTLYHFPQFICLFDFKCDEEIVKFSKFTITEVKTKTPDHYGNFFFFILRIRIFYEKFIFYSPIKNIREIIIVDKKNNTFHCKFSYSNEACYIELNYKDELEIHLSSTIITTFTFKQFKLFGLEEVFELKGISNINLSMKDTQIQIPDIFLFKKNSGFVDNINFLYNEKNIPGEFNIQDGLCEKQPSQQLTEMVCNFTTRMNFLNTTINIGNFYQKVKVRLMNYFIFRNKEGIVDAVSFEIPPCVSFISVKDEKGNQLKEDVFIEDVIYFKDYFQKIKKPNLLYVNVICNSKNFEFFISLKGAVLQIETIIVELLHSENLISFKVKFNSEIPYKDYLAFMLETNSKEKLYPDFQQILKDSTTIECFFKNNNYQSGFLSYKTENDLDFTKNEFEIQFNDMISYPINTIGKRKETLFQFRKSVKTPNSILLISLSNGKKIEKTKPKSYIDNTISVSLGSIPEGKYIFQLIYIYQEKKKIILSFSNVVISKNLYVYGKKIKGFKVYFSEDFSLEDVNIITLKYPQPKNKGGTDSLIFSLIKNDQVILLDNEELDNEDIKLSPFNKYSYTIMVKGGIKLPLLNEYSFTIMLDDDNENEISLNYATTQLDLNFKLNRNVFIVNENNSHRVYISSDTSGISNFYVFLPTSELKAFEIESSGVFSFDPSELPNYDEEYEIYFEFSGVLYSTNEKILKLNNWSDLLDSELDDEIPKTYMISDKLFKEGESSIFFFSGETKNSYKIDLRKMTLVLYPIPKNNLPPILLEEIERIDNSFVYISKIKENYKNFLFSNSVSYKLSLIYDDDYDSPFYVFKNAGIFSILRKFTSSQESYSSFFTNIEFNILNKKGDNQNNKDLITIEPPFFLNAQGMDIPLSCSDKSENPFFYSCNCTTKTKIIKSSSSSLYYISNNKKYYFLSLEERGVLNEVAFMMFASKVRNPFNYMPKFSLVTYQIGVEENIPFDEGEVFLSQLQCISDINGIKYDEQLFLINKVFKTTNDFKFLIITNGTLGLVYLNYKVEHLIINLEQSRHFIVEFNFCQDFWENEEVIAFLNLEEDKRKNYENKNRLTFIKMGFNICGINFENPKKDASVDDSIFIYNKYSSLRVNCASPDSSLCSFENGFNGKADIRQSIFYDKNSYNVESNETLNHQYVYGLTFRYEDEYLQCREYSKDEDSVLNFIINNSQNTDIENVYIQNHKFGSIEGITGQSKFRKFSISTKTFLNGPGLYNVSLFNEDLFSTFPGGEIRRFKKIKETPELLTPKVIKENDQSVQIKYKNEIYSADIREMYLKGLGEEKIRSEVCFLERDKNNINTKYTCIFQLSAAKNSIFSIALLFGCDTKEKDTNLVIQVGANELVSVEPQIAKLSRLYKIEFLLEYKHALLSESTIRLSMKSSMRTSMRNTNIKTYLEENKARIQILDNFNNIKEGLYFIKLFDIYEQISNQGILFYEDDFSFKDSIQRILLPFKLGKKSFELSSQSTVLKDLIKEIEILDLSSNTTFINKNEITFEIQNNDNKKTFTINSNIDKEFHEGLYSICVTSKTGKISYQELIFTNDIKKPFPLQQMFFKKKETETISIQIKFPEEQQIYLPDEVNNFYSKEFDDDHSITMKNLECTTDKIVIECTYHLEKDEGQTVPNSFFLLYKKLDEDNICSTCKFKIQVFYYSISEVHCKAGEKVWFVLKGKKDFPSCKVLLEEELLESIVIAENEEVVYNVSIPIESFFGKHKIVIRCEGENDALIEVEGKNCQDNCFKRCKTCYGSGKEEDHMCSTCKEEYILNEYGSGQCYEPCSSMFYYDDKNYLVCLEENSSCPKKYPYMIEKDGVVQCIESCKDKRCGTACEKNLVIFNYKCVQECPEDYVLYEDGVCRKDIGIETEPVTKESGETVYTTDITSEEFKENADSLIDESFIAGTKNGTVTSIESDNFTFNLYPADAETPKSMPKVDLGECEKKLREAYSIPDEEGIYCGQLITDNTDKKSATNKIEYDVYDERGKKLDLGVCNDTKVKITSPIQTDTPGLNFDIAKDLQEQGINIFDSSEEIFNSPCFSFSVDGKDMSVSNRKNNILSSISLCEQGCTLNNVDYENNVVDCDCPAQKENLESVIEDSEIMTQITSILSSLNLELFKCYETIFREYKNLYKNSGLWIMGTTYLINVGFMIIFWSKEFLKMKIFISSHASNPMRKLNKENPSDQLDIFEGEITSKDKSNSEREIISKQPSIKIYKNGTDKKEKEEQEFFAEDYDEMDYQEALEKDNRSFCKYLFAALSEKEITFSVLFNRSPLNPLSLQLIMFFFTIASFFFLTGLFFTEDYITKRYNSGKKINFLYIIQNEMEKSVYASIIGLIIGKIIGMLTQIGKEFKRLFNEDYSKKKEINIFKLYKGMRCRLIFVTVLIMLLSSIYLYYLLIFCSLYKNTQISWIQSSLLTIGFNIIIHLILCFCVSVLRIISLRCKKE